MITASYLHSHLLCLFFTAWTIIIFKAEKKETAVIYCEFGTIKYAHMANPSHFKQQELKATDIKHFLTFDSLSLPDRLPASA